ncbi:MAG: GFA family protein [Paracoccus sp. (in: a-proteobacteria)]|nr:GFA family protein [Paracoccus sp. (in: a-proteobacteria)]
MKIAGGCLCGRVRFTGEAVADDLRACHCGQCRRWSGHVWAGVTARLTIEGEPRWFRSSPQAERGFCPVCGSNLFWRKPGHDLLDVAPGAIDPPTGLRLIGHIFIAFKGDYYQISDGLPQEPME